MRLRKLVRSETGIRVSSYRMDAVLVEPYVIEDNSVRSFASTTINLRVGYQFNPQVEATFDVFNLFDNRVNDIQYYYESQLPGEAAPLPDRHVHPAEPRVARLTLQMRF